MPCSTKTVRQRHSHLPPLTAVTDEVVLVRAVQINSKARASWIKLGRVLSRPLLRELGSHVMRTLSEPGNELAIVMQACKQEESFYAREVSALLFVTKISFD